MARLVLPLVSATALMFGPVSPAGGQAHTERVVGWGQIRFNGHGPEAWAARARFWHRQANGLRRELQQRGTVREAIDLACTAYGSCSTLWRRAGCESHYDPNAANPSGASGLFQFLPSTWATTPFARFSIWDPYASAMAAAWMEANGQGGQWACQ